MSRRKPVPQVRLTPDGRAGRPSGDPTSALVPRRAAGPGPAITSALAAARSLAALAGAPPGVPSADGPPPSRSAVATSVPPGLVTMVEEQAPTVRPLRRVVAVIDDGLSLFEFAIACEVFGIDRSGDGLPVFDFAVCAPRPGPVRDDLGFEIVATNGLEALDGADLVVVPAIGTDYSPPVEDFVAELHRVVERGGRVASLCTGAFVLGRAGLLEGRRATTHWRYSEEFRSCFPAAELVPDVLYVEDGPIATSAGTAAGIDLCLHLVRQSLGAAVATGIARRMVVPPQRDGGQAQFVPSPVRDVGDCSLAPLLDWVQAHLDEDLSVPVLAARVSMSQRTFARRFRGETGTTPHQWILGQRVALAEHLLETADFSVEEVARRCGFGSATMLRHHFTRLRQIAPTAYRRAFGVRLE